MLRMEELAEMFCSISLPSLKKSLGINLGISEIPRINLSKNDSGKTHIK
jgi:hypothetical protein